MEKMVEFRKLGLSDKTLAALEKKGFEKPSPIQALTIPALLNGEKDVIGQAQTGTGKTAAFSLPILEKMDENKRGVKAIVLAPTRELAIQVAEEINSLKGERRLSVLPVYGGQAMDQQIRALRRGVDIVVGTPGRVQDHIRRKTLAIDNLDFFILDEADEMLNMGFVEDIETILAATNDDKKMLFFSATMPNEILKVAKKYMGEFDVMRVKATELTTKNTEQIYFEVRDGDKFEALCRVVDVEVDFYGIVFCRTKNDVDGVVSKLIERGYEAEGIHGDISQAQRERTLRKFKTKNINILVATDVAARGIDVNDLTHVINYSIPQEAEAYVHRIGRTGRAGKKGVAITFVTPREMGKLSRIKRVANAEIRKSTIPEIEEVLKAKKESLYACVGEIIAEKDFSVYSEMATELSVESNPIDVIAALLRHVYDDEFDKETYRKIRNNMRSNERGDRGDRRDRDDRRDGRRDDRGGRQTLDNQTRLFIGMGKKDNLDAKKLLAIVNKEAKVPGRKIKDIKIMNEFSFMTVPFSEAEDIIHALNATRKGGRPLVEKAKN
ncbi:MULTISPECIES: DEAD/DEAH box helicase [Psychrilyobacter]|uniref:RNA helicase n=1 Tax=Psychrilyobacter piezotolerans TaxID=2293438 RepID=A0ABX9KK83_9FUSO|nr:MULTISPECIES: DEAD/DEAH box helicase [Psychrilyobacter]MCS5420559.1 DEAD/DEAH box helicase [Psychrilyobacter sp. S5]NDI76645.1 DEAD/DEAH box helicase [Psychrilyobacter piezotolerans]RDE65271.1 ATP-dependent helicase [Psychrilyobacter sp. S5]REI42889.1 ATP-dependent helicase [Psychrilyobacter piezotolerans]